MKKGNRKIKEKHQIENSSIGLYHYLSAPNLKLKVIISNFYFFY